jgi:hypothetical protein
LFFPLFGGAVRKIKRTEVTIETEEIVIIRSTQATLLPLCPQCSDAVPLIRPEQAAAMTGATTRAIYRWIEEGLIHDLQTDDGLVFICPRSLFLAGLMPQLPQAGNP